MQTLPDHRLGQSVVEILIGIAVGAILIIGAASVLAPALQTSKQVGKIQAQTELASELANNVQAWAEGNWNGVLALATGSANTYYLNTLSSPFTIATTATSLAIVQHKICTFATTPNSLQCGFNSNVSAGNFIYVAAGIISNLAVLTATDTLNDSYTQDANSPQTNGGNVSAVVYYAQNIAGGANTTTLNLNGNNGFNPSSMVIAEISGLATSNAYDTSVGTTTAATTTPSAGSMTTTNANDLLIGLVALPAGAQTFTATNSYTLIDSDTGQGRAADEYEKITSTGNYSDGWSFTTAQAGAAILSGFKAAINSGSTSSTQSITIGGITYNRYFYLSDVYRDSNGNATTSASGNYYDPSTKQVTVVVSVASSSANPVTYTAYLARVANSSFDQTSWAGGSGRSTSTKIVGTNYYAATNTTITAGQIQLSANVGGSCTM